MSDKGILFTDANAKLAAEGIKTQTRRIIKPQPQYSCTDWTEGAEPGDVVMYRGWPTRLQESRGRNKRDLGELTPRRIKCPYSNGQRLYRKEAHYSFGYWMANGATKSGRQKWRFKITGEHPLFIISQEMTYKIKKATDRQEGWYKRSPLFMPRQFARSWYRVTEDPVPQRVHDISEADAIAEGISELFTEEQMRKRPELRSDGRHFTNYLWHGLLGMAVTAKQVDAWPFQYSSYKDNPIGSFSSLWDSIHGAGAWKRNEWVWPVKYEKIEV